MESNGKRILARNLSNLMDKRGIDRAKMATDLGVKYSTLSDWIGGRTYPRVNSIDKLADYFSVTPAVLVDDHSQPTDSLQGVISIPLIGTTIAGGAPILADEHIEGYIKELKASLPMGELFYLRVKGHSMEPTIKNGALVLINRQSMVENGDIAAVLINNKATLKRVTRKNGNIILMPDNREYEPIILSNDNESQILGKAIRITMNL